MFSEWIWTRFLWLALSLFAWVAFGFWARLLAELFLIGWTSGGRFWT